MPKQQNLTEQHDVTISDQGSVVAFTLATPAAVDWVDEHVESEGWQWLGKSTLCVDARVAPELVDAMLGAGLDVVPDSVYDIVVEDPEESP